MLEEILPNLFRAEIPLPRNPLKAVNSYIIKGSGRSLIVDTGMNRPECLEAMNIALETLDVDLNQTDFFITHLHADHMGLVSNLATDRSTIYFNQPEADAISQGIQWEKFFLFALQNGFPEIECQKALEKHPGRLYSSRGCLDFHILREDDQITMGDFIFECIETPGHSKGHLCLYEPNQKFLLSGDHILLDITPTISLWSFEENPLEEYLNSLDKLFGLDVKLVLPGHRRSFGNFRERIQELRRHHETRAHEILSVLNGRKIDAFQVASQITWDVRYESWEMFPPWQKWFAVGETIAHLKYLEERDETVREEHDRRSVFSLKDQR